MMETFFSGGAIAEKLLRNRGRSRDFVAEMNLRIVRQRLGSFLRGEWRPSAASQAADYAISLTSWSARLNDLQLTLLLLINQDVQPAGIHVWLTSADRELIPAATRESFEAYGVRFHDCLDYRSHKKWLPMILAGHRKPFVVCDDDIFYPREWFGKLISEDREDAYVGCKCHKMTQGDNGYPAPYSEWQKQIYHAQLPSKRLFTTGCGGEILHPSRLSDASLDWAAISKCAPFCDDSWIKGAHLSTGFPVYKTKYCFPCLELPATDHTGLAINYNDKKKDSQIIDVWDYFGLRNPSGGLE
jgi:hypothetical protein